MNISPEVHRQRKIEKSDSLKPKILSTESRTLIMQTRSAKKLLQTDLNNLCGFPKNMIRDIEAGKLIPLPTHLRMINSRLGLNLKLE